MRLLLLEDEPELADVFMRALKQEGYAVDHTNLGEQALYWAKTNDYDIAVFDGRLPDISGFTVCSEVKKHKPNLPVIMTTVMGLIDDKKIAYAAGADDYIVKPFQIEELLMRVHAVLRRPKVALPDVLECEGISLDTKKRIAKFRGKLLDFRTKEIALLEYLLRNVGTPLTRTMILEHVWDMNIDPFTNTVDVHIRSMRKKLNDPDGQIIQTVHGYGYKIGE